MPVLFFCCCYSGRYTRDGFDHYGGGGRDFQSCQWKPATFTKPLTNSLNQGLPMVPRSSDQEITFTCQPPLQPTRHIPTNQPTSLTAGPRGGKSYFVCSATVVSMATVGCVTGVVHRLMVSRTSLVEAWRHGVLHDPIWQSGENLEYLKKKQHKKESTSQKEHV